RTRHGRDHGELRARHRHASGAGARRRRAGGDPRERAGDRRLSGSERMSDERAVTDAETDESDTTADGLLSITDLDAGYGDLQILSTLDLAVDSGEYVSIVGPNGAGKS